MTMMTLHEKCRLINRTPPFGMAVNPLHEKYRSGFWATVIPVILAGLMMPAARDLAEHVGVTPGAAGTIGLLSAGIPLGFWRMWRSYAFHSRQDYPAFVPNEKVAFDETPLVNALHVPRTKEDIIDAMHAETLDIARGADLHRRVYSGWQITAMVRKLCDVPVDLHLDQTFLDCSIEGRMSLIVPAMTMLVKCVAMESPGSVVHIVMAGQTVALTNGDLDGRRQQPVPEIDKKQRDKCHAAAAEIAQLMDANLFMSATPRLKGRTYLMECPKLSRRNEG